jgi:hypothetical protein
LFAEATEVGFGLIAIANRHAAQISGSTPSILASVGGDLFGGCPGGVVLPRILALARLVHIPLPASGEGIVAGRLRAMKPESRTGIPASLASLTCLTWLVTHPRQVWFLTLALS